MGNALVCSATRFAFLLLLVSVASNRASAAGEPVVLFAPPSPVSPGPLVAPPSPLEVTTLGGQPRIANDGTWYALANFPIFNVNDPLEFTRYAAMLENGSPYIREGYALANSPLFLPVADLPFSQQPYSDLSIGADGTVAQVLRGTDQFTLLPDSTPNPAGFDTEDNKFDLLVIDRAVVLNQGQTSNVVPGLVAPDNRLQRISTVKVADANQFLVKANLGAGGTFDPEVTAFFELTNPGTPTQSEVLRFSNQNGAVIPGLGFEASTFNSNEEDIDYNASGSILTGVDLRGEPTNADGAIVLYDAPLNSYTILAREGEPSPLPGRSYGSLFNNPLALNDAGDVAFLGSVDGSTSDDGVIVVNGQVLVQEGQAVGTAVPGSLQLGFANANIEMDASGNIVWYGAWNELKANVCPNNTDITSSFVIYEGLFFNHRLVLEAGVTEVHDVTIGGVFYPTLVIADLPNTRFSGFSLSPDGRWLITTALVAEPNPDVCAFSINNDATPLASVLLAVDLSSLTTEFRRTDCNGDGASTIADVIELLSFLFGVGPGAAMPSCETACDCNDDDSLDIGDALCSLSALFGSGTPPAPFGACGTDPTTGSLGCESAAMCP